MQEYLTEESISTIETWIMLIDHPKSSSKMENRLIGFYKLWKLNKLAATKMVVDAQFCHQEESFTWELYNLNRYVQSHFGLARVVLEQAIDSLDWLLIANKIEDSVLFEVQLIVSQLTESF